MVYVFPDAVYPYVKIVTLKPSRAESTSFLHSLSNMLWVDMCSENTRSTCVLEIISLTECEHLTGVGMQYSLVVVD